MFADNEVKSCFILSDSHNLLCTFCVTAVILRIAKATEIGKGLLKSYGGLYVSKIFEATFMVRQIRKTGKEANAKGKMWIPVEDRARVRKEGVGLQDYWLDCWQTDPFGNRWTLMCSGEEATTDIKSTTKAKYRKQLKTMGMFVFQERKEEGGKSLWVRNLHGSKSFSIEQILDEDEQSLDASEKILDQIEQTKAETLTGKGTELSSTSLQKLLKSHSTTADRIEGQNSAAVSFSGMKKEESLDLSQVGVPGRLSEEPKDLDTPNLSINQTPLNQDFCSERQSQIREKSSAAPHVKMSQHDTLISEFSEWLTKNGRGEYQKDFAGLSSVMRGADEKVLADAIEHVKEKVDSIQNFGGYLRRAIEKQLEPQQSASVPKVAPVPRQPEEPIDKTEFPVMTCEELDQCLPHPTGYCDPFQQDWIRVMKHFQSLKVVLPEYVSVDPFGIRGQLSPICKYYESRGLDFTPIKPHLAGEYFIFESDKLPVVCFCDPNTGEYQLVVVSRY